MKIITILIGVLSALASVSAIDSEALLPASENCSKEADRIDDSLETTKVIDFLKQYLDTKIIVSSCFVDHKFEGAMELKGSTYILKWNNNNSGEITCTVDPQTYNNLFRNINYTINSPPECFLFTNTIPLFALCDLPASCKDCQDGLKYNVFCEKPGTGEEAEDDEALSVGAIVGIAVGSFVFLVGVALLIYRYRKGKWPWQSLSEAEDVSPMMVVKSLIF